MSVVYSYIFHIQLGQPSSKAGYTVDIAIKQHEASRAATAATYGYSSVIFILFSSEKSMYERQRCVSCVYVSVCVCDAHQL